MKLEIVATEMIKPFRSTPPERRRHRFSFIDQKAAYLYSQYLYFYESNNNGSCSAGDKLKLSLSRALSLYYPFAGRLRDDDGVFFVDCNDEGAAFSKAKLPCRMSEVIKDKLIQTKLLSCDDLNEKEQRLLNPLLSVQLTEFECGGHSISVFLSHKLADAATFVNFMNDWASIARGGDCGGPLFDGGKFFPPDIDDDGDWVIVRRVESIVSRRFVFEAEKIAALKEMVCEKVENPTRVEVVSALLYKAFISAATSCSANGRPPATSFLQTVNLRTRIDPPLPANLFGNIISFYIATSTTEDETQIELWKLVDNFKENLQKFSNKYPRKCKLAAATAATVGDEEDWTSLYKLHMKESMDLLSHPPGQVLYACSSWCGFPLYDVDFGSGKPMWVTAPIFLHKNNIILIDTKDGRGVEALVSLDNKEMVALEQNQELLSFCHLET